jgi:hypothetical protein
MSEPLYINVAPVTEAQVNANWRAVKELARGSLSTANKVDSPVSGLVVSAGKVKIDNFDKVADHLGNKLLAGTSITLTEGLIGGTGSKTITASLGAHQLDSSTFHTVSGLTIGHYIRATSATAFGFAAIPASEVVNTPAGNIAAVTVQAAINELDTEKTTLAAVKADADIASAISLKHAAVTVSAPIALSGQAISLVNNAVSPGTITAIDIGVVADSDTVVPTSKAVKTAIAAVVGLSDGDKGDITVSGSGTTWTIDNNAVTLAKLATQAAESILANATAGAAVPTALEIAEQTVVGRITGGHVVGLTPTQIRTLINVADGANAYTHPNHSGDVTSVADGAQTIATKAVTLAKMADMATASLIYRKTAGDGAPEVNTLATLKTDLGLTGTNSGDQTITLTGDVTGTGTGTFAATIANDAVTYAKMQDVSAADKLLGRASAGAGNVEEIACTAAGRALLDDATVADQRTTLGWPIATSVTVDFDNSMTAAQIQALINAVPKYIPYGVTVTFQFADGTYTLNATLSWTGFYGGGTINILGNTTEANATVLHTTQSVVLDFSASTAVGVTVRNNEVYFMIKNLAVVTQGAATGYASLSLQHNTLSIFVYYNYFYADSYVAGDAGSAIYCLSCPSVTVLYTYLSTHYYGILSSYNSSVYSNGNDDTGTPPIYGLYASGGSKIGKVGTQPSGSVNDEFESSGGEIVPHTYTTTARTALGDVAEGFIAYDSTLNQIMSYDGAAWAGSIMGTGTAGYIPKFSSATTIANSPIYTDGTNVGIGTSAPNAKLEILTTAGILSRFRITQADYNSWDFSCPASTTRFDISDVAGTYLTILNGGNVGIGTTAPSSKLAINGGLHVGGDSDAGDNNLLVDGTATITGAFGCNGKTAQTAYASGGAVTTSAGSYGFASDAERASLTTLVANIRTALVANGIMS